MRARAELTATAPLSPGGPCRLLRRRDAAPVAWRATADAVYLVGTAATPVGDDQVDIDVRVEAGATLHLRAAAATVAWRSSGKGTAQHVTASVARGALLDWQPEPLIATAGCHHLQHIHIQLEGTGQVRWVEELVLGRHLEQPGRLDLRLDVDIDGWPLLRHQLAVGPGVAGWDGPAVMGRRRFLGLILVAGGRAGGLDGGLARPSPRTHAGATPVASWALFDLEGPGSLIMAAADDLPALRTALGAATTPERTT